MLTRPDQLFIRQADRGHLRALLGQKTGKAAPAAADLQHPRCAFHPLRNFGNLLVLACFQGSRTISKPPAGIAHRRVEPGRVEIIAQIIMHVNIARGADMGVAV